MEFIIAHKYRWEDLTPFHNGRRGGTFHKADGAVTAVTLTPDMNINAPGEIYVGVKPEAAKKGWDLAKQTDIPVKIFIREKSNEWVYEGEYVTDLSTSEPDELAKVDRPLSRIIYMKPFNAGERVEDRTAEFDKIDDDVVDELTDSDLTDAGEHVYKSSTNLDIPPETALEGRLVLVSHFKRERNRSIINKKRQAVGDDPACEACDNTFRDIYGEDLKNCYEVHHEKMVADLDGKEETSLDDLRIVCPSCHRVIHSKYPPYTVKEINKLLYG